MVSGVSTRMVRAMLAARTATVVSGLSSAAPLTTRTLNTGAVMPALGFGTYQLEGEELSDALRCAIAAGYRHIDTAAGYENEHVVAAAIAESGIAREEFFLTSKLWCTDHGDDDAFDAILSSLAQLDTEYLDLYLIHAPNNLGESDEDKVELRRQSWAAMTALHEAGCLRAIGVSNFEPRHIEQLLEWGDVTPAVNQVEMHAYLGQAHIREYCEGKGIAVTSFGSVGAEGVLVGGQEPPRGVGLCAHAPAAPNQARGGLQPRPSSAYWQACPGRHRPCLPHNTYTTVHIYLTD